jgi:hypothetical protein
MPPRMKMFISNGNPTPAQFRVFNSANIDSIKRIKSNPTSSALSAPIIGRIHNVRPGCSSCGKH